MYRCLTMLSLQDSPDASREPMAKLSVSCTWAQRVPSSQDQARGE